MGAAPTVSPSIANGSSNGARDGHRSAASANSCGLQDPI